MNPPLVPGDVLELVKACGCQVKYFEVVTAGPKRVRLAELEQRATCITNRFGETHTKVATPTKKHAGRVVTARYAKGWYADEFPVYLRFNGRRFHLSVWNGQPRTFPCQKCA